MGFRIIESRKVPSEPDKNSPVTLSSSQLSKIHPIDVEDDQIIQGIDQFLNISDDQVKQWKGQGKIGAFETFSRQDKTESFVPFIGTAETAIKSISLLRAVTRLQEGDYENAPDQQAKDGDLVRKYLTRVKEEQIRGKTLGGKIIAGSMQLPTFMMEFIATGGLASIGKAGVKKGLRLLTKKQIKSRTLNILTKTAEASASAATRTLTPALKAGKIGKIPVLLPNPFIARIAGNFSERQLKSGLIVTEKGAGFFKESRDTPVSSFYKSVGDVLIENFSEVTGGAIQAGLAKTGRAILPKRLANGIVKLFKRLNPDQSVTKLFTRAGYNGFIGELGEERLGDLLRAALGVEDFGAKDGNLVDKMIASFPDAEALLVEAGVLAIPGATRVAASQMVHGIQSFSKNLPGKARSVPESVHIEDNQISRIEKLVLKSSESAQKKSPAEKKAQESSKVLSEAKQPSLEEQIKRRVSKEVLAGELSTETLEKIQDKQIKARATKINQDVRLLSDQIKALEVQRDRLKKAGKPVEQLSGKIGQLVDKRLQLKNELLKQPITLGSLEGKQIIVKGSDITKERIRSIKREFAGIKKGIRIGRSFTKQKVSDVQTRLSGLINESGLDLNERGKLLKSVKNVQTSSDLLRSIPVIQDRIQEARERTQRNAAKKRIKKLLKNTKPINQAGKPVGKFTPEIHALMQRLRSISQNNAESAAKLLEQRLSSDELPSATEALENKLLSIMANARSVPAEEVQSTLKTIQNILEEGRTINQLRAFNRESKLIELKIRSLEGILNGENLDIKDKTTLSNKLGHSMTELKGRFSGMYNGWFDTMDIIVADKALARELGEEVSDKLQEVKRRANEMSELVKEIGLSAFRLSNERDLFNQIEEDHIVHKLGYFVDKRGKRILLQLSKAQARKRWMEMQDPTLIETITDLNGNAYTQDMIDAVDQFLSIKDKEFAQKQLELYREFYQVINKSYSRIYGVNLPFNEFYSPISRKVSREAPVDSFLNEIGFRRSIAPGSFKSRIENLRPLREMSDVDVLHKHIMEMSHFIEFVDTAQKLNAVFTDANIRDAIREKYGTSMLDNIDGYLRDFTVGHVQRSQSYFKSIRNLRVNFTTAVLGLKPAIGVKQLASFVAYADFINTKDFTVGVADFFKNPAHAINTLNKSALLQNRGASLTRDIAGVAQSTEGIRFGKTLRLKDSFLMSTRIGDKAAIVMGGWSVYRAAIKQGKTHEEAIKAFDRATARTQQSSDLDQLSRVQAEGGFASLFTMFMSAPNQYLRRELAAIRDWKRKNISTPQLAKKIAIYHFALPMLFQFIADGFEWDEKNQLRSAIMGSFNGMFLLSDVVGGFIAALVTQEGTFNSRLRATIPVIGTGFDIAEGLKDILIGDIIEGAKELLESGGKVTGLPTPQIINGVEGFMQLEDDPKAGTLRMLGWPKSAVVKKKQKGRSRITR